MYVSSWQAYTNSIGRILEDARDAGTIENNDIVWSGPSGDYVVGDEAYDEEYADYSDSGTVAEYIHESEG